MNMYIFWIVIVSILLLAVFFAVTVAGGRAHDRQNAENASRAARAAEKPPTRDGSTDQG